MTPVPSRKLSIEPISTHSQPLQTQTVEPCHLLSLPPEIRTMIYELVLAVPPNRYGTVRLVERRENDAKPTVLSFLRTCRSIYQDAAPIFYKDNRLMLELRVPQRYEILGLGQHVRYFLQSLGRNRLMAIRHIAVKAIEWCAFSRALKEMWRLENLETIELILFDSCSWFPSALPEGLKYLSEISLFLAAAKELPDKVKEVKVRTVGDHGYSSTHRVTPQMLLATSLERDVRDVLGARRQGRMIKAELSQI